MFNLLINVNESFSSEGLDYHHPVEKLSNYFVIQTITDQTDIFCQTESEPNSSSFSVFMLWSVKPFVSKKINKQKTTQNKLTRTRIRTNIYIYIKKVEIKHRGAKGADDV